MAPKRLHVLRHAKSSWEFSAPDFDRPLAKRGVRDGAAAGEVLAGEHLAVVLCSPAVRARETWERAQHGGASSDDVRFEDAIYGASPGDLLELVRALPDDAPSALLIGHEPTLSAFILSLSEPSQLTERVAEKFPTSGLATLEFDGAWAALKPGQAQLTRFDIPRG